MPYLPDLTTVLVDGARITQGGVEYVIKARGVGMVTLPSGQVVGCDPLIAPDTAAPFTVTVEPGRYRLDAWVAAVHQSGSEPQDRTAALQLVISDQPTMRWELALTNGQDPTELGADGFFGYPVDAGVGTLADAVAVGALAHWEFDQVDEVFIPAQVPPAPAAVDAITDEASGANVIIVSSGWGDGIYPTFIGYAADGEVTSYVTDFLVIPNQTA
ncbi:DUF4241 domain-containing protein [Micromonospora coxensis]|uniref:DUF4241 domain-containing protein n=1 Tax=Micromonospora coxensis TaxID=356852 RepID=A0A1C5GWA6_9ACTN|nr:DUF4241 domain-containing protein [Micromonospora coxensis]SCG38048.1 Protein of unknown function [Micromonospora coxensis]